MVKNRTSCRSGGGIARQNWSDVKLHGRAGDGLSAIKSQSQISGVATSFMMTMRGVSEIIALGQGEVSHFSISMELRDLDHWACRGFSHRAKPTDLRNGDRRDCAGDSSAKMA